MYRTDFWTLWEKARVGCFKRTASQHVGWNRSPAQVGCMRQVLGPGALGRPRRIGWRGRLDRGSGWGTHVNPWLIHFNVWQNPLQKKKKKEAAAVRTGLQTMDWFKIGKGIHQSYILSPCLFNLYAENIMQNASLDEIHAGIKIAGRNINNLRYADETTLMAESKEELMSLLINVKEESRNAGLKLSIQKTKIMASGPITPWQIDGKTMETLTDFLGGDLQNHCWWWLQPWN